MFNDSTSQETIINSDDYYNNFKHPIYILKKYSENDNLLSATSLLNLISPLNTSNYSKQCNNNLQIKNESETELPLITQCQTQNEKKIHQIKKNENIIETKRKSISNLNENDLMSINCKKFFNSVKFQEIYANESKNFQNTKLKKNTVLINFKFNF